MSKKEPMRTEIQKLYFLYTKRPWIYPVAVGVICVIDMALIAVFYYATYVTENDSLYLLLAFLHILFSAALSFLRRRSSPQTKNMTPLIFLILPGIGALIYGASYISLYITGAKKALFDLHHAYSDEEITYKKVESIDFGQIAKLMSMSGVFSHADAVNKKDAIVDVLSADVVKNCREIKRGLADDDQEVVHYAASTLNYLETRFEKAIRDARSRAAEDLSEENLQEVVALYENYMDSGLLEDDIIPMYVKKVIETLELQVSEFGMSVRPAVQLAQSYLRIGRKEEAVTLLLEVASQFPDDITLQFMLMQYFYQSGDLVQVRNIADIIHEMDPELTPDQRSKLEFWIDTMEEAGERAE